MAQLPDQPAPQPTGLLAATSPGSAPPPASPVSTPAEASDQDPVQALADAAARKVPPKYQDAFQRVVLAGRKFMYGDDQTHALMVKALSGAEDPVQAVGAGVTQLMALLAQESRNTIPEPVFAPASLALMAEALDYVGQTQQREITKDDVARATQSFADSMLKASGIDEKGFSAVADKTMALMQDPRAAQLIQQKVQGG